MRKRYLFYFLGIASSLFTVAMVTIDTYISATLIKDPFVYGNASFIAGTISSIALVLILSIPIGGKMPAVHIDPNYRGLRLLEKDEVLYHLFAGIGNAVSTLGYYLIIASTRDPSTILPYTQLAIIYLVLADAIVEKDPPSFAEIEALLMVAFGSLLASISPKGEFRVMEFLIVMVIINSGKVLQVSAQRKLRLLRVRGLKNDSVNIRIWNLIITTAFFLVITGLLRPSTFLGSIYVSLKFFVPITIVMLFAFMANVTYIRALGIGKGSVTQAITSLSIILGLPVSFGLYFFAPKIFPPMALNAQLLVIKIIGTIFVVVGIISLALTEVKAFILVKSKPGLSEETLRALWKIRGVTSVSASAGEYDFILKIKLRTLGKAYSRIIRRIENVKGIEDYVWMSILREREEI